jgi:hypothetical protein
MLALMTLLCKKNSREFEEIGKVLEASPKDFSHLGLF